MSAENDSPAPVLGAVDTLAPVAPFAPDGPANTTAANVGGEPASPTMSLADCQRELAQRFPALFGPDGGPQPIKLRIHVDIQAQAPGVFTRRNLAHFLSRHTTSTAYLKALVKAPYRLDLQGVPAGEIAAEHRQAAQVELERRKALMAERRRSSGRRPEGAPETAAQPTNPALTPAATPAAAHARREDSRPRKPPRHKLSPSQSSAPPSQQTPEASKRAEMLRAFESSPLSKANFCALKGLREAELDEVLALALKERRA